MIQVVGIPYHQLPHHHHHPYLFHTMVECRDPMVVPVPSYQPFVLPVPRSQPFVFPVPRFHRIRFEPPVPGRINQVWDENLEYEFKRIHYLLSGKELEDRCFLASIDTEYPGVLSTADKGRLQDPHYNYEQMKNNVNATKIIQLGLTLSDRFGDFYTWQFNFNDFDLETDYQNDVSIEFLKNHGIDFERNKKHGIPSREFARFCLGSGLVGKSSKIPLTWVGFQSCYDFGYFSKILAGEDLPDEMEAFRGLVNKIFGPSVFDIKHMITQLGTGVYGGLEKVAETLGVAREAGESHTAGSDSLLTLQTFIQFVNVCLEPAYSKSNRIDTLHKFTSQMCFTNARAGGDIDQAWKHFEYLMAGEEEREKQNYRKLYSCQGSLKGLCI